MIGTSVTAVLAAMAASGAALVMSDDDDGGRGADTSQYASLGALDFSHGARAYADPGGELHLAGRTFPAKDLDYLDTDAVATSYGLVFFDGGRPMLLGADGKVVALVDGPLSTTPTASTRRPSADPVRGLGRMGDCAGRHDHADGVRPGA